MKITNRTAVVGDRGYVTCTVWRRVCSREFPTESVPLTHTGIPFETPGGVDKASDTVADLGCLQDHSVTPLPSATSAEPLTGLASGAPKSREGMVWWWNLPTSTHDLRSTSLRS